MMFNAHISMGGMETETLKTDLCFCLKQLGSVGSPIVCAMSMEVFCCITWSFACQLKCYNPSETGLHAWN